MDVVRGEQMLVLQGQVVQDQVHLEVHQDILQDGVQDSPVVGVPQHLGNQVDIQLDHLVQALQDNQDSHLVVEDH